MSERAAEDAAGVKPTRSALTEDVFPIDVPRLELRNGGVTTIGAAECGAHTETAVCEVKSIANRATDAVIRHPANKRLIHAALINEILKQSSDGIVGKRRNDGGIQTKAAFKAARDVIFAATFIHIKLTSRPDAPITWIESQHYFAKRNLIPLTLFFRFYVNGIVFLSK